MGGGVAVGARRGVSDNFPGRRLLFGAAYDLALGPWDVRVLVENR